MTSPMKATAWNTGWLFRHLDSQENFVPVTIPHDAMQAEPRTELSANGINGGWYEGRDYEYIRRFTPDKSLRNKTLMLEFEGVYHLAEVYLNGEKIAETFIALDAGQFRVITIEIALEAGEHVISVGDMSTVVVVE